MKRKIAHFISIVASFVVSVCMFAGCSLVLQNSSSTFSSNSSSSSVLVPPSNNSSSSSVLVPPEAKFLVVETTETSVIIKVNKADDNQTVLDVMQALQAEGKMSYTLSGTMVTAINGKENAADWSFCWMLYTSDSEMANSEWGTFTYNENVYGSAILGAEAMPVIDGAYYIWAYVAF